MKIKYSRISFLIIALVFFHLVCTSGERNNPVDPNNPNRTYPPVAYLNTSDTIIFINDTIKLSGTCDNPELLSRFNWFVGKELQKSTSNEMSFVWENPGEFFVSLKAIDKYKQKSDSVLCNITVLLGRPSVLLIGDSVCFINDTVEFSAEGYDTNGTIIEYIWAEEDNEIGNEGKTYSSVFSDTGKKLILVSVEDDDGIRSVADTLLLTVKLGKPEIRFEDTIISASVRDSIAITPVHYDENGKVLKYVWSYLDGKNILDTADTVPKKFAWADSGKKLIKLRVFDDDSIISETAVCTVKVGLGAIPVVNIPDKKSCFVGDEIDVEADASDINGTIEEYIWEWTGAGKSEKTADSIKKISWDTPGIKNVVVQVIDNDGQISPPDTCVITVSSGAPILTYVDDNTVSTSNSDGYKVLLKADIEDGLSEDDLIWYWDTGAPGWDDSTSGNQRTFIQETGGILQVIWAARIAEKGFSEQDTFQITFNNPPVNPVIDYPNKTAQWDSFNNASHNGNVRCSWTFDDPDSASDIDSFKLLIKKDGGTTICSLQRSVFSSTFDTLITLDTLSSYQWMIVVYDVFGDSAESSGSFTTSFGPPNITNYLKNDTITKGDSIRLVAEVSGRELKYLWLKGNEPLSSDTLSTYSRGNAAYSDSGLYQCAVSNSSGSDTCMIHLVVLPKKPEITTEPHDTTVDEWNSVSFSVVAEGDNLHYQWQKNGEDIAWGGNNDTLKIDTIFYADSNAEYRCIVSNAGGTAISQSGILNVNIVPPSIKRQIRDTTVNEGQSVTYSVTVTGTNIDYQWQKNEENISTDSTFTIQYVDSSDEGEYRCIVSNSAGSDTSDLSVLTVICLPKITGQPSDYTITVGESATLSVSANGTNINFQWRNNGTDIPGETDSIYSISSSTITDCGGYSCFVNNSAGSVVSNTVILSVHANHIDTLFFDEFTSNVNSWSTYEDTYYEQWIDSSGNGYYYWDFDSTGLMSRKTNSTGLFSATGNYSIEMDVEYISGVTNSPFGLIFCTSSDDFYRFGIADNKMFLIDQNYNDVWNTIKAWTSNSSINSQLPNYLKITMVGETGYFYINNKWVYTTIISPCYGDRFGFSVEETMQIRVNYIKITR